jgi:hypothetical protein
MREVQLSSTMGKVPITPTPLGIGIGCYCHHPSGPSDHHARTTEANPIQLKRSMRKFYPAVLLRFGHPIQS